MSDFTHFVNLAEERFGASVLWANDDFFASKDNLLKPSEAVFLPGEYTDRGKWMDGWESRRRRVPGHDECLVRLGLPGVVKGLVVDTAHFKGNFPESVSFEAASLPGQPTVDDLLSESVVWTEILPRTKLQGDSKNLFAIASSTRFTHVRMHIYPDGGVARLRVHGEPRPGQGWLGRPDRPQLVDLAAVEHGALVVACNDMFFGSRHNLIMPGRGVNMGDGWETKRSRREGPDWVVVRLATEGLVERAVVDTAHFKGNFPESAALCVAHVPGGDPDGASDAAWTPLLPRTKLQAHTAHQFEGELEPHGPATHVRMRIWPDGGVSRLRLLGIPTDSGRERAGLTSLASLPETEARAAFRTACGSTTWAMAMAAARPFADLRTLLERADAAYATLATADWDEAFSAHPRIGGTHAQASADSLRQSAREQSRVAQASDAVRAELAEVNQAYEARFGRTYIVCATGKSAEEMLALAKERLGSAPDAELRRAIDEQKKITELRLRRLVLG